MKSLHNWIQKNLGYDGLEIIAVILEILLFIIIWI